MEEIGGERERTGGGKKEREKERGREIWRGRERGGGGGRERERGWEIKERNAVNFTAFLSFISFTERCTLPSQCEGSVHLSVRTTILKVVLTW